MQEARVLLAPVLSTTNSIDASTGATSTVALGLATLVLVVSSTGASSSSVIC